LQAFFIDLFFLIYFLLVPFDSPLQAVFNLAALGSEFSAKRPSVLLALFLSQINAAEE
jgi:hypothetical protein